MLTEWLLGGIIGLGITIRIVYILVHRHLDKKLVAENKLGTDRISF